MLYRLLNAECRNVECHFAECHCTHWQLLLVGLSTKTVLAFFFQKQQQPFPKYYQQCSLHALVTLCYTKRIDPMLFFYITQGGQGTYSTVCRVSILPMVLQKKLCQCTLTL
jgi:hypothetical protein